MVATMDPSDPKFTPLYPKSYLQSKMPKKSFIYIMDKFVLHDLVGCKNAAEAGKTSHFFYITRVIGSNLCDFDGNQDFRIEEVLNFIKAHMKDCKVKMEIDDELYTITVDWS